MTLIVTHKHSPYLVGGVGRIADPAYHYPYGVVVVLVLVELVELDVDEVLLDVLDVLLDVLEVEVVIVVVDVEVEVEEVEVVNMYSG